MVISHAHFPILSSPTHHQLHAWGVFNSFFFIITLNLTTITLRPRETRKSIKFSFSSPSIAFLCFFLSRLLFIHHLVGLAGLLDCITFFLDVCTLGSAAATIRSGSLTFNHYAAFDGIKKERENWRIRNELRVKVTTIVVQSPLIFFDIIV